MTKRPSRRTLARYTIWLCALLMVGPLALQPSISNAGTAEALEGTHWRLTSWGPVGAQEVVPEEVIITLEFTPDGTAAGSAGCNRYTSNYQIDDGLLSLGAVASTRRACVGDVMDDEERYLAALETVSRFELVGERLRIYYRDGDRVLEWTPIQELQIEGVTPNAVSDGGGRAYVVQAGDWLSVIAADHYGDPLAYERIIAATNAKAAEDDTFQRVEDAGQIEVGQKLWLPGVAAATAQPTSPAATPSPAPTSSPFRAGLLAATYPSDHTPSGFAPLVDGEYQVAAAPGSATQITVQLAYTAYGDLNGDGVEDAAVILISDPGGSGSFRDLVVVINHAGTPVPVIGTLLGDRVKIEALAIESGEIVVGMITHGPNDPLCCPTQEISVSYALELAPIGAG